eukprot:SAG31_NODE_12505_length_936_cov_1.904421_2_plen_223_part_01
MRALRVYSDSMSCLKLVNSPGVAQLYPATYATGELAGRQIKAVRPGTDTGQLYRRLMAAVRQDLLPGFQSVSFAHVHSHTRHEFCAGNDHADNLVKACRNVVDVEADGYRLCARLVPQWVPLPAARGPAPTAGSDAGADVDDGATTDIAGFVTADAWAWLSSLPADALSSAVPTIKHLPAKCSEAFGWCIAHATALLESHALARHQEGGRESSQISRPRRMAW